MLTRHHELKVSVRPVLFAADKINNPGENIAITGAAFIGTIPVIGWIIGVLLGVIGGVTHVKRRGRSNEISRRIWSEEIQRPWEWSISFGYPGGPHQDLWVWGDWVPALGLRPATPDGGAPVAGTESTRALAEARATRARDAVTRLIA